ncbi:MAG: hypothetical protein M3N54_16220 [Acidobacteriota bacterium]|nr:hypothetical protein [Acidobacteriota bacterium]
MPENLTQPIFSPIPPGLSMPFFYASLTSFWVFYKVDPAAAAPYLKGTGLKLATFKDFALASVDLQYYTADYGIQENFPKPRSGMSVTTEIEFNIWAYPESREEQYPAGISAQDFIMGQDQTKTIGGYRVWVPCDNKFAIKAGKEIFGENKFYTVFDFNTPSANNPAQTTWSYKCYSPEKGQNFIYSLAADLTGTPAVVANPSSISLYGDLQGRLVGSHWNLFGQFDTYFLNKAAQKKVVLTYGTGKHKMRADMEKIIGSAAPYAVQIFQSHNAAAESRGFYANYPAQP